MTYEPKTYRKDGGDKFVVADGGEFAVESGGELDVESGGIFKLAGTEVTADAGELNILDGVTADTNELNLLDGMSALVNVVEAEVDMSAGGQAQTAAIATIPAGSIILEVVAFVTESLDGDATKEIEVGVTGNTDKYIDPDDMGTDADDYMSMAGGTNNDQKVPEYLASETDIIATWTNHDNASAGEVTVKVIYIPAS